MFSRDSLFKQWKYISLFSVFLLKMPNFKIAPFVSLYIFRIMFSDLFDTIPYSKNKTLLVTVGFSYAHEWGLRVGSSLTSKYIILFWKE